MDLVKDVDVDVLRMLCGWIMVSLGSVLIN